MANKSVLLYQYVEFRNKWKYIPAIEPLKRLTKGSHFLSMGSDTCSSALTPLPSVRSLLENVRHAGSSFPIGVR